MVVVVVVVVGKGGGCEWQRIDKKKNLGEIWFIYIYAWNGEMSEGRVSPIYCDSLNQFSRQEQRLSHMDSGLWPAVWDATITGAVDHKTVKITFHKSLILAVRVSGQLVSYSFWGAQGGRRGGGGGGGKKKKNNNNDLERMITVVTKAGTMHL